MNLNRLALAAGMLLAASGVTFAQSSATIIQSGSNDQASIEQNASAPGSIATASIAQSFGADNTASVLQGPNGPPAAISAAASVRQSHTFSDVARVVQIGTTAGTDLELSQSGGNDSSVHLLQADVSGSRIRAYQLATNAAMTIQQGSGSASSYAGAEQVGDASMLTILQGRPGAATTGTQARIFQYGDGNIALTAQYGVNASSSFVSQGSPQMPGYYFSPGSGVWVEVDGNVLAGPAMASTATMSQDFGSNLTGYILQYGSEHYAYVGQSGNGNVGGILQSGSGNNANLTQTGILGTATIAQLGHASFGWIFQSGTGNNASIKQR